MSHDISNFWVRIISAEHGNSERNNNWYKISDENLNKNKTIGSNIGETTFRLQAKYNDTKTQVNCSKLQFSGRICYPSPNTSSSCTNFLCGDGCIGGIINGIFSCVGVIVAAIIARRNVVINL